MRNPREKSDFVTRATLFGVNVCKIADSWPRTRTADALARQIIRSSLSVGANLRAALRGRSNAEMIAKLGIALEEADECQHWLEVAIQVNLVRPGEIDELEDECEQLIKMLAASIVKVKSRSNIVKEELAEYFCQFK